MCILDRRYDWIAVAVGLSAIASPVMMGSASEAGPFEKLSVYTQRTVARERDRSFIEAGFIQGAMNHPHPSPARGESPRCCLLFGNGKARAFPFVHQLNAEPLRNFGAVSGRTGAHN